jgi:hypothetical protein
MFSKFVVNRELQVPESAFSKIKAKYDKDLIIDALNRTIEDHSIMFPIRPPSLEDADMDFQDLCALDSSKLLIKSESTSTRYTNKEKMSTLALDSCNVGNKTSNYFHWDARMNCDSINSPSPMRVWAVPKFRRSAISALFSLKLNTIDAKTLAQCIALRKYVASQFRPSAAKSLYDRYAVDGDVLDMCAGWGDRLTGFLASNASSYEGYDTNLRLHEGYRQQIARYGEGKIAKVKWEPVEKADLGSNRFDLAFTSPPYFNIERYSKDDTQSYHYKEVGTWLSKFLIPLVENSFESLKTGGRLIVNISDVYSGHRINNICDPMNDHLKAIGAQAGKHFIYRMAKRVGGVQKSGMFGEPCFVWRKK